MRTWMPVAAKLALWMAVGGFVSLQPSPTYLQLFAAQLPTTADHHPATPVILISVDTLRADHLSSYGYKVQSSRHIDRIATGGTTFLEANSQVPLTLPSHVSMLTSTFPFSNGVEDNGEQLGAGTVTLAEILKSQGYRTAAFVGSFVLDRRFGLDRGFEVYDGPSDAHSQPGKDPGDIKRFGENVTRAAIQWLDKNSGQPFFLFVHLYDLHTPYQLPGSEHPRGLTYNGELQYVDSVVGKFWDALEQRGLIRRSLIVFTSDHGESLHDHGESTHGYYTYQSTLHVPLIIHWPAQLASSSSRIAEPVSLLDVPPTIVEAVGIARPAKFQGRSLLSLAAPHAKQAGPEEIYSESLYPSTHFGTSALRTLRVGRYKYIQAPRPEFYDLMQDPAEAHNLYENQKSTALSFRNRLALLRSRFTAARASTPHPEAMEKLRSLGYLAAGSAGRRKSDSGVDPKDRIADYESYGDALALASAGHLTASNNTLEQLIKKDPNLPDVRASLGLNQQKLGRYKEAAENFRAVLKQNPLSAIALFNLAICEHSVGKVEEAAKDLEATLAIAPHYVRAEEMVSILYLRTKKFEQARAHLNHLLEIDPANYTANYNLGVLACMQGAWHECDQHLHAALQADPRSAEAHDTLGKLYLRQGDMESARASFTEAIRLNPSLASAHYGLGLVFQQQYKKEEATREFQKTLAADPNFQQARQALDRLTGPENPAK